MDKMELNRKKLADEFLEAVEELEKAKNQETQYKMCEALYKLELYVPVKGEGEVNKDSLYVLVDEREKRFIPAFLYKNSKLATFEKTGMQCIKYLDLKYYVIDSPQDFDGIVINPFEQNFVFDDNFIEIADSVIMGMSIKAARHPGKVTITRPNNWNLRLINDLYKIFDGRQEVKRAWLFNSKDENSEKPYITVLVDFDGEKIDLFPSLAEIMHKHLQTGDCFELIQKGNDFDASMLDEVKIFAR